MGHSEQVSELLLHWEELNEQGQPISATELCRDCPELLEEVRGKIQALQAMFQVPNRVQETLPLSGWFEKFRTGTAAHPRL